MSYASQPMKSPGLAVVLSFFWMGLGQIYNGQIGKGIIFMITEIVLAILTFLTLGIMGIVLFALWVWNLYDAYRNAEKYNLSIRTTSNEVTAISESK